MKYLTSILISLIFIFISFQSSAQIANPSYLEGIDSLMNVSMKKYKIPGMVLGIIDSSHLVKIKSYGFADVQNAAPTIELTTFELASLSKQFTASAILLLQQNNKLSVEDYLFKYFPECPDNWKDIKIKHLIWHTSGLPGMWPRDSFKNNSFTGYSKMSSQELDLMMQTNNISKKTAIQSIITDQLDSKPGEKYNYSDVGYLLLGLVIDNVAGSYRTFMQDEIFLPSNMLDTYIINQDKLYSNQSRGYSLKDGEIINIMRTWDYEIPSFFGVFSNVSDLYKWHNILFSDTLLNAENRAFLFSKGFLNNGKKINYGGGWSIQDINSERYIFHGGVTGVNFIIVPHKNISVISLTNLGYNGNDGVMSLNVAKDILQFLKIENKTTKNHITSDGVKVVKIQKKRLSQIIGNYKTIDQIEAKIYIEDNIPFFDCPAQGMKSELVMLENENWLLLGLDIEYVLEFNQEQETLTSNLHRTFKRIN